ncbi:MAG: hypothetical protein ACRD2A_00515 [Vicinamibacterales bacterium]
MRAATVMAALLLFAAQPAGAQAPTDPRAAALVSTDPIRCWWQSDAGAVTIGQSFAVTLTCAVVETDAVQVIPDESRLGVATVRVAPFEILGGSHPADARDGSRRFFQYRYTLRIIDPDVIGRDVKIPSLPIQYKVRNRVNAASTLEGRDLTYVMPSLPIKVLSMVPAEATDIRDGSDAGFAAVDALRFRASLFRVVGTALALVALIMGVWALTRWAQMARRTPTESAGHIPDRAVLHELQAAFSALRPEADRGWSDDLVVRTLPLVRLVSSLAIGRPISQHPIASSPSRDGRLPVSHGVFRPARAAVAAAVTANDVASAMAALDDSAATKRGHFETLRDALMVLTEAAYRKAPDPDPATLDEALNAAIAATRRMSTERTVLGDRSSRLRRTFAGTRS